MIREMLGRGSTLASFLFVSTMFQKYFPYSIQVYIERYFHKLVNLFYPYIEITFHEFSGDRLSSSKAYSAIENYLSSKSTKQATRLKADVKIGQSIVLSMADHEEVLDKYEGIRVFWSKNKTVPRTQTISFYAPSEKRYYKLTFHKRYRELITSSYLKYVLEKGKAIGIRNRQRKLYTNGSGESYNGYKRTMWSHVVFEHPASFETLAMDPIKKKEIMDDLETFSKAKEYYARIGKAWKRGYLLYGPPGTGKSTMIAAIANFLNYDIYDLELTSVKNNTDLRKLLIETSSKSIIVIEDIDCSLALTGQRKKKAKKVENKEEKQDPVKKEEEEEENKSSQVTLSGLLNFIDGLWSASGGERLIIFTTNYVEKLDGALIRRGRMDKHIELSYCDFEGFKVLAKNYLCIESHELFDTIESLLKETKMTPADVSENLMPKSIKEDAETCLKSLIQTLKNAKEEARVKAEKKERLQAVKDSKEEESAKEGKAEDKEPAAKEDDKESVAKDEVSEQLEKDAKEDESTDEEKADEKK